MSGRTIRRLLAYKSLWELISESLVEFSIVLVGLRVNTLFLDELLMNSPCSIGQHAILAKPAVTGSPVLGTRIGSGTLWLWRLILLNRGRIAHSMFLLLQPTRNLTLLHCHLRQALLGFGLGINISLFTGLLDDLTQLILLRIQARLGLIQAAVVGVYQALLQILCLRLQAPCVFHGSLFAALGFPHLGGQLRNTFLNCLVDRA